MLKTQIEPFDLELIVERLQLSGLWDCDMMPPGAVQEAFLKWLNSTIESINDDPQWWVQHIGSTEFKSHLPELPSDIESDTEVKEFATF